MLKDCMVNATKEELPCKKEETKQSWMTKDIIEKMRERKKAKVKEIEMDCRRAKDEWWHIKCEEVETLQSQHWNREIPENIKEVTGQGHKQKGSNCIQDKKGICYLMRMRSTRYGRDMLQHCTMTPAETHPDVMNDEAEEIMVSEVEKAIKNLKDKKAPGKGDITAEMIKSLDHCTIPIVHRLVSNSLQVWLHPERNE